VVEGNRAGQTLIACGCIETKAKTKQSLRLLEIDKALGGLVTRYQPDEAAVESLFYFKNAKTVISVAEARGAIVVALQRAGLLVADYTPLQVKQSVTGYGRADKKQVEVMVKNILKLKDMPKQLDDAIDGVAVALTHLFMV
jgi:crossover junction endodeoxyribonuclease RuvC